MKAPLSWLKEFVDIEVSADELAEKLLLSGTKVEEVIKDKDDIILDLEITSNRPDCLSIIGLAREISAITGSPLKLSIDQTPSSEGNLEFSVKVSDPTLLPIYSAVVLENVKIAPSSALIQDRLTKSGIRPLNNLVDITNYVMLQTGQPMHAFDYDKIAGHELNVRVSTEGEEVITLDQVKRKLKEGGIIIEDSEKLIDLAGLMGGTNTEISGTTTKTLILFPIFDPVRIRKTSTNLNFRTEASSRLEKLLDPEGTASALATAVKLLQTESEAQVASRVETKHLAPINLPTLELDLDLIKDFLGIDLSTEEVEEILKGLGFETSSLPLAQTPTLRIIPPSWRRDILIPEDIIEEVGRIYGYNNIPSSLPAGTPPPRTEALDHEFKIKTILTGWGLNEAVTYTLVSKEEVQKVLIGPDTCSKVLDPMSVDFEYLRPTLLIGLLNNAKNNQRLGYNLNFFEIGRVFKSGFTTENLFENQPKRLSGVVYGSDFPYVKGILDSLLKHLKVKETLSWEKSSCDIYNNEQALDIKYGDSMIGSVGLIKETVTTAFDLTGEWYYFNVKIEPLINLIPVVSEYRALPKYPSVIQDISFVVAKEIPVGELLETIKTSGGDLLKNFELVDVYVGEKSGEGNKSVTVRLYFQSDEKTLTDSEVAPLRETINQTLNQSYNASIR